YHYSSAQYAWKESGENGHPLRSQPPQYFRLRSSQPVRLPAFSLSVVRGKFSAGHLRSTNNTSNRPAVPKEGLDDSRCPASLASQESLASDQGPFDKELTNKTQGINLVIMLSGKLNSSRLNSPTLTAGAAFLETAVHYFLSLNNAAACSAAL